MLKVEEPRLTTQLEYLYEDCVLFSEYETQSSYLCPMSQMRAAHL